MSTKRIEIISRTSSVETVEKTPWEKGWETRRRNQIAEKDKKIADLEQQLAEQKSKKNKVENELKHGF